jgi:processing peptidase subunit alpha
VDLLADSIMHASFTAEEVAGARQVIAYQRAELQSQPQALATEHLYTAAYGADTPLGRPDKCPDGREAAIDAAALRGYMAKYFTAPRMTLAAVNVEHGAAVELAEKHFGGLRATAAPGAAVGRVQCPYVGGDVRSSPDWSAVPATAAAAQAASKTDLTHVMLALPTVGWCHDDIVPVCVVDTLLGGGSSFSAGGPGKGMYSRLYREVLNMNSW